MDVDDNLIENLTGIEYLPLLEVFCCNTFTPKNYNYRSINIKELQKHIIIEKRKDVINKLLCAD